MTRAAIKHGEELLRVALLAGDVVVLDRLLHDSLLFTTSAGTLVRKEEDLENHRTGRQKLERLATRDLVVELHGGDLGVVTLLADLEGTFDGRAFGGHFRYLRTWRRDDDGVWRVIAGAVTTTT